MERRKRGGALQYCTNPKGLDPDPAIEKRGIIINFYHYYIILSILKLLQHLSLRENAHANAARCWCWKMVNMGRFMLPSTWSTYGLHSGSSCMELEHEPRFVLGLDGEVELCLHGGRQLVASSTLGNGDSSIVLGHGGEGVRAGDWSSLVAGSGGMMAVW